MIDLQLPVSGKPLHNLSNSIKNQQGSNKIKIMKFLEVMTIIISVTLLKF